MKEFIYSRNAVYETLSAKRRQVFSIDIAEGVQDKGKIEQILQLAKEQKIKVIAVHLGGESRKGALSDKFIDPVVAKADGLIVTEDSNKGGVFTNMAKAKKIPLLVVKKSVDVGGVLKGVSAAK